MPVKFTENLNILSGANDPFGDSTMNAGVEAASHKARTTQEIANSQPIQITGIAKRLGITSTKLQERELINYLKKYFVNKAQAQDNGTVKNEVDPRRGFNR